MDNNNGRAMALFAGFMVICAGIAAVLHVDISVVVDAVSKILGSH